MNNKKEGILTKQNFASIAWGIMVCLLFACFIAFPFYGAKCCALFEGFNNTEHYPVYDVLSIINSWRIVYYPIALVSIIALIIFGKKIRNKINLNGLIIENSQHSRYQALYFFIVMGINIILALSFLYLIGITFLMSPGFTYPGNEIIRPIKMGLRIIF